MTRTTKGYTSMVTKKSETPFDFHPTPECAIRVLLDNEKFKGTIWEPAAGKGSISRYLLREGLSVEASDIQKGPGIHGRKGVDFLRTPEGTRCANVVTNPPYSLLTPFLETALRVSVGKVAFLVNSHALWGRKRAALFERCPPDRIHILSRSIPYFKAEAGWLKGGMMLHMWIVWDLCNRHTPQHAGREVRWHDFDNSITTYDRRTK